MRNLTLLTDLYQLTMGQGYFNEGKHEQLAAFDVFFRPNKLITYSVAAGMEQVLEYLENLHFEEEDIAYLRSLGLKVLRYTNIELHQNFKGVCEDIWNHLPNQ